MQSDIPLSYQDDVKGKGKALPRSWSSPASKLLQEQPMPEPEPEPEPSAAKVPDHSAPVGASPSGKLDGGRLIFIVYLFASGSTAETILHWGSCTHHQ